MSVLRVVLDTNVVLSALLFRQGRLSPLSAAWQSQRFTPVANRQTVSELTQVLGYPKFKLSVADVQTVLSAYLPHVEVHSAKMLERQSSSVAQCRDPKDQIFLDLALSAQVDWLVSGDEDLLVLDDPTQQRNPVRICSPFDLLKALG